MASLRMLAAVGVGCLATGASALRAMDQGRYGPAQQQHFAGFAHEAMQQGAAVQKSPWGDSLPEVMKLIQQAQAAKQQTAAHPMGTPASPHMQWAAPQVPQWAAALQQQKPPAMDVLEWLKEMQQKASQQKASPPKAPGAPANPLEGVLGWMKQQQQKQQQPQQQQPQEQEQQQAAPAAKPEQSAAPTGSPLQGMMDMIKGLHKQAAAAPQTTAAPAAAQPAVEAPLAPQTTAAPAVEQAVETTAVPTQPIDPGMVAPQASATLPPTPSSAQPMTDDTGKQTNPFAEWVEKQAQKAKDITQNPLADWIKKQQEKATAGAAEHKNQVTDWINGQKEKAQGKNPLQGIADWIKNQTKKAEAEKSEGAPAAAESTQKNPITDWLAKQQKKAETAQPEGGPELKNPFADWIKKQVEQKAEVSKEGASTEAKKRPFPFTDWIVKQQQAQDVQDRVQEHEEQQKAAASKQEAGKNKLIEGISDWFNKQQKKAAGDTADAVNEAAKNGAHNGLKDFLEWARRQGDKAAQEAGKRAAETASKEAKSAATASTEASEARADAEKVLQEASQKAQDTFKDLMNQAHSSAEEAAKEEAPKVIEQTAKAEEHARETSKAAVDGKIEEAERHFKAMEAAAAKADRDGEKKAAEAAHDASQKAMEDLLNWAEADSSAQAKRKETKGTTDAKSTGIIATLSERWAEEAQGSAKAADALEHSAEELAASAERLAGKGHETAKKLWKGGLPGATVAAMGFAKDVAAKANETIQHSATLSKLVAQTKHLVTQCIRVAMKASNPDDFRRAWAAVKRAYGAAGKVEQDAHWALVHSRDAALAVSGSLAEVAWRAVSEVLKSEVALFIGVAKKAHEATEGAKSKAWVEGLATAQQVGQAAFLKGFSEGMAAVAGKGVPSKVMDAAKSVGTAGVAWSNAVVQVMGSKDGRHAISQAAKSAARGAAAAAVTAAGATGDSLQNAVSGVAKAATKLPFVKKGSHLESTGSWSPKDGYHGHIGGVYGNAIVGADIYLKPNKTHERMLITGGAIQDSRTNARGFVAASKGHHGQPGDVLFKVEGSNKDYHHVGVRGHDRYEHVNPFVVHVAKKGKAWAGPRSVETDEDLIKVANGQGVGKAAVKLTAPELTEPLRANWNMVKPLPGPR